MQVKYFLCVWDPFSPTQIVGYTTVSVYGRSSKTIPKNKRSTLVINIHPSMKLIGLQSMHRFYYSLDKIPFGDECGSFLCVKISSTVQWSGRGPPETRFVRRRIPCCIKVVSCEKQKEWEAVLLRLVNDILFLNRIDNLCRPSLQISKPVDVSILRPS